MTLFLQTDYWCCFLEVWRLTQEVGDSKNMKAFVTQLWYFFFGGGGVRGGLGIC